MKRHGMRLFLGEAVEGEICPECVLQGTEGAAAKVRSRIGTGRRAGEEEIEGEDRSSWFRRMDRRARLLEEASGFSLAARQAAVRETRERR